MTTPSLPTDAAATSEGPVLPAAADFVLGGRNVSAAQHIAGLLSAGLLKTAGTPALLLRDEFPGLDPEVLQEIWNRAAAMGFYAGRVYADPERHRQELMRLQERYREAAFEAMGAMVGRSLRLVQAAHPADDEGGREHWGEV
ncbi:hypothetical protein [Streptomyces sp. NPDC007074]|uniref:hypothetical protein n=1 Tax=Streptomyces sp. NPDC007074 TaxID=3156764 RepID=UPI0034075D00